MIAPGDRIEVELRGPAHGGSMVAGMPGEVGRTVFVRHGLPGERGSAVVTGVRSGGRIVFADLVAVDDPSPDRVGPPCPVSGPGGCGGCDYQHVAIDAQRRLKATVVADALRRIAGLGVDALPWDGQVRAVPGDSAGLRWRTRGRFMVSDGALAMQGRRSHDLVPIDDCPITVAAVVAAAQEAAQGPRAAGAAREVHGVVGSDGKALAGTGGAFARRRIRETVLGATLQVSATGFWQVHPGAPTALCEAVQRALQPTPKDTLLDLYAGAGLFSAVIGTRAAAVHAVEGDRAAVAAARENLRHLASATVHRSAVAAWLERYSGPADTVVLDPPRSGAGEAVLRALDRLRPRAVAYVACDPAALARDLRTAVAMGWQLASLEAYDIFPMTHHVECVAGLVPPA